MCITFWKELSSKPGTLNALLPVLIYQTKYSGRHFKAKRTNVQNEKSVFSKLPQVITKHLAEIKSSIIC